MADESTAPTLLKPIPDFATHERAAFGPIRLFDYIDTTDPTYGPVKFYAECEPGGVLPDGLICTLNGIFGGIPAANTEGNYRIAIIAENNESEPLIVAFTLTIKPALALEEPTSFANFKSEVWKALGDNLPLPELTEVMERPITPLEIYYLLERYAVLTIWNVNNLEAPSAKKLLEVKDNSEHYYIYDRGSCLVAAPKDLFSQKRTLEDAYKAARALAHEAYKRGWTIEFAGFNKMVRIAWIELQLEADKNQGKRLEILHYEPSEEDIRMYQQAAKVLSERPSV